MSEVIIETRSLSKNYGPHVAIDSIDLQIRAGATGLLGPNGAGKSTLLKTILGLIALTSGGGKVLGHDIATEGPKIRQRIGYMPEYDCLIPDMEAIHQVRYAGELIGMNSSSAVQRAHEVLEYVGLRDQRYRTVSTFSTGMEQATKLACALIHDPDLLICDEPTNGLDANARGFMLDTLFQVVKQGGRSIIMSSHLMDDVERICDRMLMIHKGQVIAQGRCRTAVIAGGVDHHAHLAGEEGVALLGRVPVGQHVVHELRHACLGCAGRVGGRDDLVHEGRQQVLLRLGERLELVRREVGPTGRGAPGEEARHERRRGDAAEHGREPTERGAAVDGGVEHGIGVQRAESAGCRTRRRGGQAHAPRPQA